MSVDSERFGLHTLKSPACNAHLSLKCKKETEDIENLNSNK